MNDMDLTKVLEIADKDEFEKSMRGHKYIFRTGTPGNYTYHYKQPGGGTKSSRDDERLHKQAKMEHARRLVRGKRDGRHDMSHQQIADKVGLTASQVRTQAGIAAAEEAGRRARTQDHHPHELIEAKHRDVHHDDYNDHIDEHHGPAKAAAHDTLRPTPDSELEVLPGRGWTRGDSSEFINEFYSPGGDYSAIRSESTGNWDLFKESGEGDAINSDPLPNVQSVLDAYEEDRNPEPRQSSRVSAPESLSNEVTVSAAQEQVTSVLGRGYEVETRDGEWIINDSEGNTVGVGSDLRQAINAATPVGANSQPDTSEAERMAADIKEKFGIDLTSDVTESAQAVEAAVEQQAEAAVDAITEAVQPGSAATEAVTQADPDFARSDDPVQAMVEGQNNGENPYVNRARDIYDRIKDDLKASRRDTCKHMFAAIDQLKEQGKDVNEANLKAAYNGQPGRSDPWSKAKKEFESGTFMQMDEVLNNPPVNIEMERMKRGFAAKQYARMEPYLSDSFTSAHPDAPPPYPTYNDLKTWSQFGTDQASHITTPNHSTDRAMPQEFYDSVATGPNGKAVMPPASLPLHLMPAWNYLIKSKGGRFKNAFDAAPGNPASLPQNVGSIDPNTSKVEFGSQQQGDMKGVFVNGLRRYVQMRGGVEQMVDIPNSKLPEGVSHRDLFKSDGLSDDQLWELARTKIFDPVGLTHAIMDVDTPVSTSKSFGLYIDSDEEYVPGENFSKGEKVVIDLRKARIEKIRGIISKRNA